jgi:hypothetical protein
MLLVSFPEELRTFEHRPCALAKEHPQESPGLAICGPGLSRFCYNQQTMEAPRCIVCQTKHWSTQPCPAFKNVAAEEAKQQRIAKLRTTIETVTETPPQTVTITPLPVTQTHNENPVPATVPVTVSVTLATQNKGGRPRKENPLSNAERQRRWRQNQKLKAAIQ